MLRVEDFPKIIETSQITDDKEFKYTFTAKKTRRRERINPDGDVFFSYYKNGRVSGIFL